MHNKFDFEVGTVLIDDQLGCEWIVQKKIPGGVMLKNTRNGGLFLKAIPECCNMTFKQVEQPHAPAYLTLHYGYQEGECGIYHAFTLTDPDIFVDPDDMGKQLASMLDCSVEDPYFNWDEMDVTVPESFLQKLREETTRNAIRAAEDCVIMEEAHRRNMICYLPGYHEES